MVGNPKSGEVRSIPNRVRRWTTKFRLRQLVLESKDPARFPLAPVLPGGYYLPVQLYTDVPENPQWRLLDQHQTLAVHVGEIGGFGRQAQAVHLLDRVLSACHNVTNTTEAISRLEVLDTELRHLLTVTMSEYRGPGSHCGVNATALRLVLPDVY
jgi:hypothetical protein